MFVFQVRAVMSSDSALSPFIARTSAVPAGSSICNNMSHTVVFSIGDSLLTLQVDDNGPEFFPFSGFTPCSDLNVPLYMGGVKGQSSHLRLLLSISHCRETLCVCVHRITSQIKQKTVKIDLVHFSNYIWYLMRTIFVTVARK